MADQNLTHAASLVPVGAHAGKPAMPLTRPVITIGSGKHNRINLKSDSVSTTHALLVHTDAGWYVRDLGSRTHTILNGRVAREATLKNGDTLTIGAFVFQFETDARGTETPAPAAALELAGEIPLPVDTKTIAIGRRTGCEVRLEEESASNVHAILFEADGVHFIRDLYSRTGTWLNGAKVHQEPVKFGDEIRVGETVLRYAPDHSELYAPPADDDASVAPGGPSFAGAVAATLPNASPDEGGAASPVDDDATIPVGASARDTIDADGTEPAESDADVPVLPLARRDVLDAGPLAADSFVAVEPETTPVQDALGVAEAPSDEAVAIEPAPALDRADAATDESAADIEAEMLGLAANGETTPLQDALTATETASDEVVTIDPIEVTPAASVADVEADVIGLAADGETTPLQDAIDVAPELQAKSAAEVAQDHRPQDVVAAPAAALEVPPAPPADSVPAAMPEAVEAYADQAEAPVLDEADALAASALVSPLEPTPASPEAAAGAQDAESLARLEADVQAALDDPTRPLPPLLAPGISAADAHARLGEAGRRTRLIAEMLERHEDIVAEVERAPLEFAAPEPAGMAAGADDDLLSGASAAAPIDEVAPLEFADVPIETVVPPLADLDPPLSAAVSTEVEPLGFADPQVELPPIDATLTQQPDALVTPIPAAPDAPTIADLSAIGDLPGEASGAGEASVVPIDSTLSVTPTSLDAIAAAPSAEPLPTNDATDEPLVLAVDSDERGVSVDDAQAPIEADAVGAGDVIATGPIVATGPTPEEEARAAEAERARLAAEQAVETPAEPASTGRRGRGKAAKKAPAAKGRGRRGKAAEVTAEVPAVGPVADATPIAPEILAPEVVAQAARQDDEADVLGLAPAAAPAETDAPPADPRPIDFAAEGARQSDDEAIGVAPTAAADTLAPPTIEPGTVDQIDTVRAALAEEATSADASDRAADFDAARNIDRAANEDAEADVLGLAPAAADDVTVDVAPVDADRAAADVSPELAAVQSTLGLADSSDALYRPEPTAEIGVDQAALDAAPERVDAPAAAEADVRPMMAMPLPLEIGEAPVAEAVALDADRASLNASAALDLPTTLEQHARPLIAADEHLEAHELEHLDPASMVPAIADVVAAPLATIDADALTGPAAAPPVGDVLPDSLPADAVERASIVIASTAEPMADASTIADGADVGVGFVNQFDAAPVADRPIESIEPGPAELAAAATASGDVALDLIAADEVTPEGAVDHNAVDPVVAAEMVAEPEHVMSLTPAEPTPHEAPHHPPSEAIADDRSNAERLHDFAEPPPPTSNSTITVQGNPATAVVNVTLPSADEVSQASHDAFADALAMAGGHSFASTSEPRQPVPSDPNSPWVLDESLLNQAEASGAPASNASVPGPSNLEGFLNLGGIGYIGDPALDEYEPATPHKRTARPERQPRPRRPVFPAADAASRDGVTPPVQGDPAAQMEPIDSTAEASDSTDVGSHVADPSSARPTRPAAPEAATTTAPLPISLPPRPRRLPPRGQAGVEQSLAPAGSPSPFAAQALPLVDVFSGQSADAFSAPPTNGLDDVLAKLGPTHLAAPVDGDPPITTDAPAQPNNGNHGSGHGMAGLAPTPFASHVPIAQPGPPRRRPPAAAPRRTAGNLSILLWLAIGLTALATATAWYWPVARTIYGEVAFEKLDKLNSVEQARVQSLIRARLVGLKQAARAKVDDRYGDGFLDRDGEYRALVTAAQFSPQDPNVLILRRASDARHADADRVRLNALLAAIVESNQELVRARDEAAKTLKVRQATQDGLRREIDRLNAEIDKEQALAANRPVESELRRIEQEVALLDEARQAAARTLAAREAEFKRLEAEAAALGVALGEGVALAASLEAQQAALADGAAVDLDAPVANVGRTIDLGGVAPLLRLVSGRPSSFTTLIASPSTGVVLSAVEVPPVAAAAVPTSATTDADLELARLTKERDAARARLDQLLASQAPEARTAREGFDKALEAFADDVEKAGKALGDRPEVLAYVQSARALQDQIRRMTDTLVRRQQQQITRLGEFKRRLADLTDSTREQRFGDDEQLKTWNDRLAIRQRQLNAAREAGAPAPEIDDIQRDVAMLESTIAGRKEVLNDPRASIVTKELEGMIATTQRELLQDRADNEKLLADVQEAFRRQQPAVEKLPDDQKELARQLAGRLAQIDLARQRYTNSLGIQAGGEALQIAQARQRLEELNDAVALRKSTIDAGAQAQAAEMERRTRVAKQRDEARAALVAARTARDEAEAAYAARATVRDALAARLESTRQAGERQEALRAELDVVKARSQQVLAESTALQQQVNYAVVPLEARPAVEIAPTKVDPRLVGGGLSVAAIWLCFSPFLVNAYRRRSDFAAAAPLADALPADAPATDAMPDPLMADVAAIEGNDALAPAAPTEPAARIARAPFPPSSPNFPSSVTPA